MRSTLTTLGVGKKQLSNVTGGTEAWNRCLKMETLSLANKSEPSLKRRRRKRLKGSWGTQTWLQSLPHRGASAPAPAVTPELGSITIAAVLMCASLGAGRKKKKKLTSRRKVVERTSECDDRSHVGHFRASPPWGQRVQRSARASVLSYSLIINWITCLRYEGRAECPRWREREEISYFWFNIPFLKRCLSTLRSSACSCKVYHSSAKALHVVCFTTRLGT